MTDAEREALRALVRKWRLHFRMNADDCANELEAILTRVSGVTWAVDYSNDAARRRLRVNIDIKPKD
jgi:hypothetical protein